jgi:hypothetical protein
VKCNFAVLYETFQFPASNNEPWQDPAASKTASLANDKGVVLRVVDFPPRTETLYHRTISLDFGILFEGEIDWYVPSRQPAMRSHRTFTRTISPSFVAALLL